LNEDDELTELHSGKALPPILGSQHFVDACRALLRSDSDYEIPQAKALSVSVTLDDIIDVVSARVAISRPDLIAATAEGGGKRQGLTPEMLLESAVETQPVKNSLQRRNSVPCRGTFAKARGDGAVVDQFLKRVSFCHRVHPPLRFGRRDQA